MYARQLTRKFQASPAGMKSPGLILSAVGFATPDGEGKIPGVT
jgi:hypothetical protein